MHSVSAKDKDLTVIRVPYRHLYGQFIQTHERKTKNITTVGMWFYFTVLYSVNELLHISPIYCCSARCVSMKGQILCVQRLGYILYIHCLFA